MLNSASDIFQAFLDGVKMTKTATVLPDKFTRIWNEWAMRDWMKSHGLFDDRVESSPIIRDKFKDLIVWARYVTHSSNKWKFTLPDGETIYGVVSDPNFLDTTSRNVLLSQYVRHLSLQVKLDYDTNTSQKCNLTGESEWLDATQVFDNVDAVLRSSYYLKPSDDNILYRIEKGFAHIDNGGDTEPIYILLEYVKWPEQMSYNDDTGTFSYTIEFNQDQLTEIVDSAVRIHIEGVQNPRYQSFLNEEKIRHR